MNDDNQIPLEQARKWLETSILPMWDLTDYDRKVINTVLAHTAQPAEIDEAKEREAFERYVLTEFGGSLERLNLNDPKVVRHSADDGRTDYVTFRTDDAWRVWKWLARARHAASVGVQQPQCGHPGATCEHCHGCQEAQPSTASVSAQGPSDEQIQNAIASIGMSDNRPLGMQWDSVCKLVRQFATQQPASAQAEPVATVTVGDLGTIRAVRWKQELAPGVHPLYLAPPPATSREVPEGTVPVPIAAWYFLTGAAPLDGVWFGERHPAYRGGFWWRGYIANMMDGAAPAAPKEGV